MSSLGTSASRSSSATTPGSTTRSTRFSARAALCWAEDEDLATPNESTAGWGYLRLRRPDYSGTDLAAWAERIRGQPWSEAFVFFKHEEEGTGPRLAGELRALLA